MEVLFDLKTYGAHALETTASNTIDPGVAENAKQKLSRIEKNEFSIEVSKYFYCMYARRNTIGKHPSICSPLCCLQERADFSTMFIIACKARLIDIIKQMDIKKIKELKVYKSLINDTLHTINRPPHATELNAMECAIIYNSVEVVKYLHEMQINFSTKGIIYGMIRCSIESLCYIEQTGYRCRIPPGILCIYFRRRPEHLKTHEYKISEETISLIQQDYIYNFKINELMIIHEYCPHINILSSVIHSSRYELVDPILDRIAIVPDNVDINKIIYTSSIDILKIILAKTDVKLKRSHLIVALRHSSVKMIGYIIDNISDMNKDECLEEVMEHCIIHNRLSLVNHLASKKLDIKKYQIEEFMDKQGMDLVISYVKNHYISTEFKDYCKLYIDNYNKKRLL